MSLLNEAPIPGRFESIFECTEPAPLDQTLAGSCDERKLTFVPCCAWAETSGFRCQRPDKLSFLQTVPGHNATPSKRRSKEGK